MKQMRLTSIILISFFLFTMEGKAQRFVEDVLKAVEEAATESISESISDANKNNNRQSSSSSRRVTGFKVVSPHPDLEIKIKRCAMTGTTVVVDLVVTNYGRDTKICFCGGHDGSEVFDDEGNLYKYGNVQVGVTGDRMTTSRSEASFPTEIPLKVCIQIENVVESIQVLKRINLRGYCNSLGLGYDKPIIIHNIPITQQ